MGFVIQTKRVPEKRRSIHCVQAGASSRASNLVTVMPMQKNVYARRNLLVLAMPSALMTRSAVCGVRLRKGRRQENARASPIRTVSANLLQRMKTTRSNDMIQQYGNIKKQLFVLSMYITILSDSPGY